MNVLPRQTSGGDFQYRNRNAPRLGNGSFAVGSQFSLGQQLTQFLYSLLVQFGIGVLAAVVFWIVPSLMVADEYGQIEMAKRNSPDNAGNNGERNAVSIGDLLVSEFARGKQSVDFNDLLFCDAGNPAPIPASSCSVTVSVPKVFFGCAPANIGQDVVHSVAIQMAALHSIGARANKSFQNEPVDFSESASKPNYLIARFSDVQFQHSFGQGSLAGIVSAIRGDDYSRERQDSSEIRYAVTAFKPDDGKPLFGHCVSSCFIDYTKGTLFDQGN